MSDPTARVEEPVPPRTQDPDGAPPGFELLRETKPPGLVRRFWTTVRHLVGLLAGGLVARGRERRTVRARLAGLLARPFVRGELARMPFHVQFRRRLEMMGATYIKLGQILSLREDLLPPEVTRELKNLLDRLPVLTYRRFRELVEAELKRPVDEVFTSIDAAPIGSASIAQAHRAWTLDGDAVILKLVKPGIRETLRRDRILLNLFGGILEIPFGKYRPKRIVREFFDYTEREVDLRREADNAETFQANFRDMPEVVFPRIYRGLSTERLLCMEFLDGMKPDDPRVQRLSNSEKDRLIDLGAKSIIRMLYQDGFFHADLHPGNLLILPDARCAFIDLGMVGRFDDELRRNLLYYFFALVSGDSENAARFLVGVAEGGSGANPDGFRREVEEICRRWHHNPSFEGYSLGRLVLESVGKAAQFRMYFPVEMVLMVKALITFEGVGHILRPDIDVAKVSQGHVRRLFLARFSPLRVVKEGVRGAPEVVEALMQTPSLITEGLRFLERTARAPQRNPLEGLRGSLFAGACVVSGAILVAFGGPPWLIGTLFGVGVLLMLWKPR